MARLSGEARTLGLLAAAGVLAMLGTAGCTGGATSTPPRPSHRMGNPTDTASPMDTSTAGRTPALATATPGLVVEGEGAAQGSPEVTPDDVAACLAGSWTAPLAREFTALGIGRRSGGIVRGGTGLLHLTFTSAHSVTLTYDRVVLNLVAGTVHVAGPVTGTWSMSGDTLRTVVSTDQVSAEIGAGGVSVNAGSLTGILRGLPPAAVFVTCTNRRLELQPAGAGTDGTVTLDRG